MRDSGPKAFGELLVQCSFNCCCDFKEAETDAEYSIQDHHLSKRRLQMHAMLHAVEAGHVTPVKTQSLCICFFPVLCFTFSIMWTVF